MKKDKGLFTNKALLALIIPLIIENALSLVVGMIDSIMVSSAGEAAVSGVSLIDTVMVLIIYLFSAMAAGGAVVAGQYLGGGDKTNAKKAAGELVWINGLISIAVTVLVFILSGWIVGNLFGDIAEDVAASAGDYLFYTAFSIPAIALFNAGTSIFRTMGDTKTTMKVSLLMNLLNCAGNALLIYGCSIGVAGAAISTLIARWAAAVLLIALLLNQKRELSIERSFRHHFNWSLFRQIARVGIPGGIENGIFQVGKIALVGLAATFGTTAITANAVTQTLASIEVIPGGAVQLAIATVISRCVGAGEIEQAKYYNRRLILFTALANLGLGTLMYLGLPLILGLYTLSAETAALIGSMFLWHTIGAVSLWPMAFVQTAALRAAGDVKYPMLMSIVSMWVFRFVGAYLLCYGLNLGAVGIWISMAMLDWGFRAVVYALRWKSGKWESMKVI
ncbi:MATE family efflux transporter [Neglectibacter caecimuris]|uniref:MATE family efflux transporter n=1 Tax=Neglectibacter caecimuris TaxID=3093658 RepID=UPI002AC8E54F|nr:MATE family efflux transporter [Neglectibacter sp. M00184]